MQTGFHLRHHVRFIIYVHKDATIRSQAHMGIAQKIGILIFTGVPAIMGGGIIYSLTHGFTGVVIYEAILYLSVAIFCLKK